jgi:MFS family permease
MNLSDARFKLLLYLGSLTFILYLDRVCIGKAATAIEKDLGISDAAMGWVFTAFTIAYGLFEVPTGSWGDRYGSRRILTRIVLWWSAFTILTGCVPAFSWGLPTPAWLAALLPGRTVVLAIDSFLLLLIVRFLFGAGEAGALPNAARVVSRWYPRRERGLAHGVILTCMLVGGAASPILAGKIIQNFGWRWTFLAFGLLGLVWGALFYAWFRDDPAEHPEVSPQELQWIRSDSPVREGNSPHPPIPWAFIVSSSNVWLLGGIISCAAFASYFYFNWFPRYLENGRGLPEESTGWLAGLVLAGGACGSLSGSVIASWLDRRGEQGRWRRPLVGSGLMIIAGLFVRLSLTCENAWLATLCVALAFGFAQAQQATWWAVVADISGKHLGAMFGLMNSLGVPGASLSTVFAGQYVAARKMAGFEGREAWDPALNYYAAVLVVGGILWLCVDPRRSAVEPDAETAEGLRSGRLVPAVPEDLGPEPVPAS